MPRLAITFEFFLPAWKSVRNFLEPDISQFEQVSCVLRNFLQQPLKNLNCKCNITLLLIARQASDVHFSKGNFTRRAIPEIV